MQDLIAFTTPLMRSSIGFNRFNDLFEFMIGGTDDRFAPYSPYNIEKAGEAQHRIVIAVAGFTMKDLDITTPRETLIVSGKAEEREDKDVTFLHRGIAARAFQRTFRLADHIKVTGAEMQDGLLTIHVVREQPEKLKPHIVPIHRSSAAISLDSKKTKKPLINGKAPLLRTASEPASRAKPLPVICYGPSLFKPGTCPIKSEIYSSPI